MSAKERQVPVPCHFRWRCADRSRQSVSPGTLGPRWKDAARCHFPAAPTTALGKATLPWWCQPLKALVPCPWLNPRQGHTEFAPSFTQEVRAKLTNSWITCPNRREELVSALLLWLSRVKGDCWIKDWTTPCLVCSDTEKALTAGWWDYG